MDRNSGELPQNEGAAFARGVGFEDRYSTANAEAAGAVQSAPHRTTLFSALHRSGGQAGQDTQDEPKMETYEMKENPRKSIGGTGGDGNVESGTHQHVENVDITRTRRCWVFMTWAFTFWIPTPLLALCGRMKRPDVRMAWREKVAICAIIFILCFIMLFIIIGLGLILCPRQHVWTMDDISSLDTPKKAYMSLYGNVYDITDFIKQSHGNSRNPAREDQMSQYAGLEANASFPIYIRSACPKLFTEKNDPNYQYYYPIAGTTTDLETSGLENVFLHSKQRSTSSDDELSSNFFYKKYVLPALKPFKKGDVVWKFDWVNDMYKQGSYWRVINKEVFNMEPYFKAAESQQNINERFSFLNKGLVNILDQKGFGTADVTDDWDGIDWTSQERDENYACIRNLFYVGKVDNRQSVRCLFTNYMLLAFACLLMLVVLVKFLTALQFGKKKRPTPPQKFVICQVPCYTEDEESLTKTINSLCALEYGDKQKLIFVICDGNIVGSGNDKSTPRIVLDVLGVDPEYDPPGRDYLAIAEGSRRHNIGKIYSGLYEFEGHVVPFMVVAKVGTPEEASRSGNRGKRDSQILLMSFFNKVHFDLPMTPLELEMYHQMRHIIGVPPINYEYLLQIDADTEVMPDSLTRLVSACSADQRIAGICGETMLGNESKSWTTMMQVYEYFISHHMAKAFESLFGSVTCLPGCFCMYRLRTAAGKPLLIAKPILEAYSELHVDTLHKKNLLSLGEDRYLTTLMMKHFPQYKLKFIQDAKCKTIAPEKWSVLLSQRRRWINSTIHNLAELMFLPELCGFCCFSMRFVVFLDLFGTITMPTTIIYFAYLIYAASTNIADVGYISLIIIGATYGLQAVIFILRREWQHVGWMLIYLCAYPIWSFVLPLYSFWHMDDFSWGNTRVVVGDGKRKIIVADDKPFDPESIPQRRWIEYEKELASAGVLNAPPPNMNPNAGSSKEDERQSLYSSLSGANMTRLGSSMGFSAMAPNTSGSVYGVQPSPAHSVVMGIDPRLSTAMTSSQMLVPPPPPPPQQQQMPVSNVDGSPYSTMGYVQQPPSALSMYSNASAMQMQPNTMSVYSNTPSAPGMMMRPDSYASSVGNMQGAPIPMTPMGMPPSQPGMDYMGSPNSGRSTPVNAGMGMDSMLPSDEMIVEAIRRILAGADLNTTTKKRIRLQLSQEFGVDLSSKKDFISYVVDQVLVGNM